MGRSVTEFYETHNNTARLNDIVPDRETRITKLQSMKVADLVIIGLDTAALELAYQASFTGLRVLVFGAGDIGEGIQSCQKEDGMPSFFALVTYVHAARVLKSRAPKIYSKAWYSLFSERRIQDAALRRLLALAVSEEGSLVINYLKPFSVEPLYGSSGFRVIGHDLVTQREFRIDTGILVATKDLDRAGYSISWSNEQPGRVTLGAFDLLDAYVIARKVLGQIISMTGLKAGIPELHSRLLPNQKTDHAFIADCIRRGISRDQAVLTESLLGSRTKWMGENAGDFEEHELGVLRGVVRIISHTELVTGMGDLLRRLGR